MALGRGLGSLIPQKQTRNRVHRSTSASGKEKKPIALHVAVKDIMINPEQPRKNFTREAMQELIASIKEHGILQPLLVSEKTDGTYELIAGERRLRAAQMINLVTVPAVLRQTKDDQEKLELALIENIQRADLNIIEEACAYERFVTEFGLSPEQIGARVGKARTTVTNIMRLLSLPDEVQKALIDGKLSMGKARALAGITDPKEQLKMFAAMIGEGVTVRDVEQAVQRSKRRTGGKGLVRRDPNVMDAEDKLRKRLGTKVRITKRGEKGKVEIEFYSAEEYRTVLSSLLS